ncbi:NADH--cytochrome b5 reductase 1-like isoform X1 [Punica granatum]|nr:NADH--cytochrome b5 reductase 1-like isoform X1 [Punica granatum]
MLELWLSTTSLGFTELPYLQVPFAYAPQVGVGVALLVVGTSVACFFYLIRKRKGCLDPKKFKEFKLIKKTQLSSNTAKFRFALPTPTSVLGLPVGEHVVCRGKDEQGKEIIRPYTPITLDSDLGYFELVVKMYPKGRMSHHFRHMRIGDYLPIRGPVGRFRYSPGQARAFGMLAGGSGITPMFQLIRAILENPKDKTNIHLIYANTTYEDILLKEEMDDFAMKFPDSFKVYYVLSKPPEGWNGGVGHIMKEMIQSHCPPPAFDIQILRCGPPVMNKAMAVHLNALGYTSQMQFEF